MLMATPGAAPIAILILIAVPTLAITIGALIIFRNMNLPIITEMVTITLALAMRMMAPIIPVKSSVITTTITTQLIMDTTP